MECGWLIMLKYIKEIFAVSVKSCNFVPNFEAISVFTDIIKGSQRMNAPRQWEECYPIAAIM